MKHSRTIPTLLTVFLCMAGAAIYAQEGNPGAASLQDAATSQEPPLTNADIIKMSKLELGDDVIIAKINQARKVAFQLDTDSLLTLNEQGVSKNVITAMLERSGSAKPTARPGGAWPAAGRDIVLVTEDGEYALTGRTGTYSAVFVYVGSLDFLNIHGTTAEIRTSGRKPTIAVSADEDPRRMQMYLVKLDPDKDEDWRSLKMGRFSLFSLDMSSKPDKDWTIRFDTKQVEDGLWHLTPVKNLKPGEYGIYLAQTIGGVGVAGGIYDFGID